MLPVPLLRAAMTPSSARKKLQLFTGLGSASSFLRRLKESLFSAASHSNTLPGNIDIVNHSTSVSRRMNPPSLSPAAAGALAARRRPGRRRSAPTSCSYGAITEPAVRALLYGRRAAPAAPGARPRWSALLGQRRGATAP